MDARLALLRAKQRALRDLSKLLRDTGVKAAATLRTLETAIAALADDEARQEEGWYPDLAWPPAPEDED